MQSGRQSRGGALPCPAAKPGGIMTALIVGSRVTLRTVVRANNQQNQLNLHHYEVTGQVGGVGQDDTITMPAFALALKALYLPRIPVTSSFDGIMWTNDGVPNQATQLASTTPGAGTGTGDALAPQLCVLTSWRSSAAPVGVRGRSFWPSGLESDESADGTVAAASVALYLTFSNNVRVVAVTSGLVTTTFTKRLKHISAGIASYLTIDTTIVRTKFCTQRRRSFVNRSDLAIF